MLVAGSNLPQMNEAIEQMNITQNKYSVWSISINIFGKCKSRAACSEAEEAWSCDRPVKMIQMSSTQKIK